MAAPLDPARVRQTHQSHPSVAASSGRRRAVGRWRRAQGGAAVRRARDGTARAASRLDH
jgi:hypothetical protein